MIDFDQDIKTQDSPVVSIKVVGVGGGGGNTVNSIADSGYNFIECIALNTDVQALGVSKADIKMQLGLKSTKGMGTGANPELGKRAAEEDLSKVMDVLEGSDIVFLTGGMGGGTGSGALPVIARALKEKGILSIAVVTRPFEFEGRKRARVAQSAIELLQKEVDTLLIVPNQKLLDITDKNISMIDAFALINNVLGQSVKGISEIITCPGHINVDFADVKAIMKDAGIALMGCGTASGQNRATEAALQAICSPLLENMSIHGATGVLLNITGGKSLGLHEIGDAASIIYEQASEDANIILGSVIDDSMGDNVTVTIIATGFEKVAQENTACDLRFKATNFAVNSSSYKASEKIECERIECEKIACEKIDCEKIEHEKIKQEFECEKEFAKESNRESNKASNLEAGENLFQGSSKIEQEVKKESFDPVIEFDSEISACVSSANNGQASVVSESLSGASFVKQEGGNSSLSNLSNSGNSSSLGNLGDLNNVNDMNDLDVPSFMRKSI